MAATCAGTVEICLNVQPETAETDHRCEASPDTGGPLHGRFVSTSAA
jgi:hypothetical protein